MNASCGLRRRHASRSNSSGVSSIGWPAAGDGVTDRVEHDVAELEHLLEVVGAAQASADAGDQLDVLERLGDVVVGAGLQAGDDVTGVRLAP